VSETTDREQLDRVRERFTRTAQQFAEFSLATRSAEAERLVSLAGPLETDVALDLACGPGTFARAFAQRVKFIYGLDLTPALLRKAREATAAEGLSNVAFACGEATALPCSDASFDVVVCAYSFHHFANLASVLRELARVLRPGGRAAVVDLIAPGDKAQAQANNRIEQVRDPSHARTLAATEISGLFGVAGFRILATETTERWRSYDDWMGIAGWEPGDPVYVETRRLLEASLPGDTAGFHPRLVRRAAGGAGAPQDDLQFVQTSFFIVATR